MNWQLVVAFAAVAAAPLFTYWLSTRNAKRIAQQVHEGAGEERREREVVSMMLLTSNKEIAAVAKETAATTMSALSQIYAKVDGSLTKAQEAQLASARATLAATREVITMKQDRGVPVLPETLEEIPKLEAQIAALAAELKFKHEAMTVPQPDES